MQKYINKLKLLSSAKYHKQKEIGAGQSILIYVKYLNLENLRLREIKFYKDHIDFFDK